MNSKESKGWKRSCVLCGEPWTDVMYLSYFFNLSGSSNLSVSLCFQVKLTCFELLGTSKIPVHWSDFVES